MANKARRNVVNESIAHLILGLYTIIALAPVLLVVMNSFKGKRAIFKSPLSFPTPSTFDLSGYQTVLENSSVYLYFFNSLTVTVVALFFILLFGAMTAFALSEYRFPASGLLGLYFAFGIMIPIRLGTLGIINIMQHTGLGVSLVSLILVYTAQGLPLAVFILSEFMRSLSKELKEAARIDGWSEYKIFFRLILPLLRPAMATVAVFTMIPVWNDLWFPLVLANTEKTKTLILWAQTFQGQFQRDYGALLASLTLAILPVIVLYLLFSKQLIRGLTSGAVK